MQIYSTKCKKQIFFVRFFKKQKFNHLTYILLRHKKVSSCHTLKKLNRSVKRFAINQLRVLFNKKINPTLFLM